MAQLGIEGLHKAFAGQSVIDGIDLDVADGELCVLLGPSGCGKSTLLRLLAGLETPDAGRIRIGGRDVTDLPPKQRNLAMVFQSYALYPHMSVYDNLAFGLRRARRERSEIDRRVRAAAEMLHIAGLLARKPGQLSGGQRQRVAIGRAIVREPEIFLLDEPLSNLDADLRVRMRVELAKLQRQLRTTMVYVTHDQVEAMTLADRLVVLHQGRIAQQGPPLDLYQRPRDLFVAGFIGSPRMNLLPGTLEPADQAGHAVVLPGGQRIPVQAGPTRQGRVKVTLGIRPEHLQLAGSRHDGLEAETVAAERLGDQTLVHLRWNADQEPVLLRIPGDKAPAMGERLRLKLPKAACHLFDAAGKRLPETEPQ